MNSFRKNMMNLTIILGVIILVFVIVVLSTKGNKNNIYNAKGLVNAAKQYFNENSHLLPSENFDEVIIDDKTLIDEGLLKHTDNDLFCESYVSVSKIKENIYYTPTITCNDERDSNLLYKTLLKKVVTEKDGLYEEQDEYIFKGENPDNFVSFAGLKWRIIKINNNNEIKLILTSYNKEFEKILWDNRYNIKYDKQYGINDYDPSRIKETLNNWLSDNKYFGVNELNKIARQDLCVGARSEDDKTKDGKTECSKLDENQLIGLIQANEYFRASLDQNCLDKSVPSCRNYNFLHLATWTITPYSKDSASVWLITTSSSQSILTNHANNYFLVKPVIYLKNSTTFSSGSGTNNNPYIIK